jgi:hypothetical protein
MDAHCGCRPVSSLNEIKTCSYFEGGLFHRNLKKKKKHPASFIQNFIFGLFESRTSFTGLFPPLHRELKESTPSASNASQRVAQFTVHEPVQI